MSSQVGAQLFFEHFGRGYERQSYAYLIALSISRVEFQGSPQPHITSPESVIDHSQGACLIMANVTRSSQALGTGRPKDDSENLNPQALLDGIQKTLCQGASEVLFSVGGKINLTNDTPPDAIHGKRDPVRIYWTSGAGENHPRMMSFPTTEPRVATTEPLAQLLKDCEPATFGRGNQEVLDEDYRQASKMDVQRFASDYSPYENRVMEKVSQALAFRDVGHNSHRGLWAELYKLNVGSIPR